MLPEVRKSIPLLGGFAGWSSAHVACVLFFTFCVWNPVVDLCVQHG